MNSIRSVRLSDLDSLVRLAQHATYGLTTLLPEEKHLHARIKASIAGDSPLLVMVDESDENVIGTAGMFTRVGDASRAEPFYAYRLERSVHQSESLHVHVELDALHLVKMFNGPTELGTLFLHPEYRGGGNGRVMSLSRFLLMVMNPAKFDRQVIAEMRGVVDDKGYSPFWDAIGRYFFKVEFPVADALSARDKHFIAELMPSHPIYVPLLPKEAQAVIANVHPHTVPARRLLESEGFYFSNMVDIFDGGPCLRCDAAAIRSIREAKRGIVTQIEPAIATTSDTPPTRKHLIARATGEFRLVADEVRWTPTNDGEIDVAISASVASTLEIQLGDAIFFSPLRGESNPFGSQWPVLVTGSS